jgi:hypothetical protein
MLFIRSRNSLKIVLYVLLSLSNCTIVARELAVGTYNSPPFSMQEDGEDIGLATEAVQDLLRKSGISEFTISYYPVTRGLFELETSRIDIYYPYVVKFSKGNDNFVLIGPISRYRVALFVRKDYDKEVSLESMRNLALGAERGSIGYLVLDRMNMHIEQASQEVSCLRMVIANRVSACAMGTLSGMYSAAINNLYGDLRYVETDEYADMYIALRPSLPKEVIEKIRNTFEGLKKENYFEIKQRDYERKFATFIKSLS